MRTSIDLDEKLLNEAIAISGINSKKTNAHIYNLTFS
jgi:Arc/MetJ family transcription regulator